MGIFDSLKDKATELLGGAADKVTEATGIDLSGATDKIAETTGVDVSGVADQATQATEGLADQAQGHAEAAQDQANAFGDQVTGATGIDLPTEGLTDQATDKFGEATGR
ncbi:hypothetical protein [Kribbella albertanoniae]|uniref:hypothetical protein n=1 Tax=Kribbella albertanoniae TaxID=1266829 RepID=UPI00192D41FF|nr:hypothetical protein [Kribbella albertanoniae]